VQTRDHQAKKLPREDLLFYLFLGVLFLSVSALSLFLLSGERKRAELAFEYEAEKLATTLMDYYRDNRELPLDQLRELVLGFGVYSSNRTPLERYGSAPASLEPAGPRPGGPPGPSPEVRFLRGSRSLVLIRRLGWMPGMHVMPGIPGLPGRQRGPRMMGRMGGFSEGPQALFLELSAGPYWARERLLSAARILLPLALAGLTVLAGVLFRRGSVYRRRLAAQEQLARLGEASRALAHEIKNPLSAIRIQTGLLSKTLPEARRGDLRIIEEETQRLALLADRIGDFLRDPLGQPEALDLDRFLGEMALRYDRQLLYRFQGQPPARVNFDRERLRSVLENLIRNAQESMDGRPAELECEAGRHQVEVAVLDRGPGIPPEIRDKIFDPFFTSKAHGSGFGLSIARRFVEAAGGSLSLEDRPGGGTRARIVLKREPA
jgi:two-component system sensor histidine kinase HydH